MPGISACAYAYLTSKNQAYFSEINTNTMQMNILLFCTSSIACA